MKLQIEESAEQEENEAQEIRKPENVVSLLNVDPIELEFGYGIIPLADVNQGGDLLDRVVMIRRQIALGAWCCCSYYHDCVIIYSSILTSMSLR